MARALSACASLRHCKFSPQQLPLFESECSTSIPSTSRTFLSHGVAKTFLSCGARNTSAAGFRRQGGLLLKAEFWGRCVGRLSSNGLLGATTFGVGPPWGDELLDQRRRTFRTSPISMGRRSAKIATRKGAQDKKKAKVYGRIGKQIITAVKAGGPDAKANVQLAAVLQTARQSSVPKDIIDRNIKKASDKDQAEYVQQTYEVYGAGGVGIVVEAFTDNLNRAAANIRDAVKKAGGKMADPGSVMFNFDRKGIVSVYAHDDLAADDMLLIAMDAGADDVLLPEDPGDSEEEENSRRYKVVSPMDQFTAVKSTLAESSIHIDEEDTGLQLVPLAHIEVDDGAAEINEAIMERLLDLDDVDSVYSNMAT